MQSSLGGVLRALVMLVCLILGPLMALPDVSFPIWLKQSTKGTWIANWWGNPRPASNSQIAQAKPAQPTSQRSSKASSSLFGALPAALGQAEAGWPSFPTSPDSPRLPAGQTALPGPAAITANLEVNPAPHDEKPQGSLDQTQLPEMATAAQTAVIAGQDGASPTRGEGLSRDQGVIPTAFVEQSRPSRPSSAAGLEQILAQQHALTAPPCREPPAQASPPPSTEQLSRFRVVEERLRTLGAAHYLLEAWGNATEYYRFRCRMPIAGSSTAVRHFEATDSDGLAAMSRVLKEIEAWKAQSL